MRRSRSKTILPALIAGLLAAAVAAMAWDWKPTPITRCPRHASPGRLVEGDISGSERSVDKTGQFLGVVQHALVEAGVCDGPAVVEVWAGAGTTRVLWGPDDPFTVTGSTDVARSNSASRATDRAMTTITTRYQAALREVKADGSDVVAWASTATDTIREMHDRDAHRLEVIVVTDGVMVTDTINLNRPITVAEATALAEGVSMPDTLSGQRVTMIGIGSPTGPPPPAGGEWVNAVRRFAEVTCRATGASCEVLGATVSGTEQ